MVAMMNVDVEAVCGPKGRHDPARTAVRHGSGDGSVTLGGRRVPVTRPRMRAADGTGELPVAAYELFSLTEVPGRMAMLRMLAAVYALLSDRVGTGGRAGRAVGSFDEQVRGVAAVYRRD